MFCGSKWFCDDVGTQRTILYYKVLLQHYSVLQSTAPVLQSSTPVRLCTTKYYSSTTLFYKANYSVLHRPTPVLLVLPKYYASTTLALKSTTPALQRLQSTTSELQNHKVLLQYYFWTTKRYSILQNTTPVLYSVLHSTTPVLLCTTKYYSVKQSTTPVLLRTTKYCSVLILGTYEPLFTLRGAPGVILQLHQILRLPCKWLSRLILVTSERVFTTRRATEESSSNVTKYCAWHEKSLSWLLRIRYETKFSTSGTTRVTR